MRILIDGEACPKSVQKICLKAAKKNNVPIFVVEDFKRQSMDGDAATDYDFNPMPGVKQYTLAALIRRDDIVITYDYNLAAEVYPKVLVVLHPGGFIYNDSNMDRLLYERYLNRNTHQPAGNYGPRIQKRTAMEDKAFETLLFDIVSPITEKAPYIQAK